VSNRPIAIVDPYSAGAMLAQELWARNVACVAVLSSPRVPAIMRSRFDRRVFGEIIEHDQDIDATIAALKRHDPGHVVAGFESGVLLADQLSEALSLQTNGTALSRARRDKYLMSEAVRRHGLPVPRLHTSNDVEGLLAWIRSSLAWPVILKPAKSAASDQVVRCASEEEVRRAARAILNGCNVLGEPNETVIAQEFLDGTEYVVDAVAHNGLKKTTAVWQYHRSPEGPPNVGYDAMTLLPYQGDRQRALESYAFEVLDALGIRFGPAHCELMWVNGGPRLVEVGARLSGGINAILSRLCGGICQLDETIDTLIAPDRFLASLDARPQLVRHGGNVFLMPGQTGLLVRLRGLDAIESLPTFHSMSVGATPGQCVRRVAGRVTLIGDDPRQVVGDIGVIRALVRNGLFELAADPGC